MVRLVRSALALFLCATLLGINLGAQQHVADAADLQRLLDEHVEEQETLRAAVERTLARPEVERVARGLGIDLDRVADAVSMLDGAELAQIASQANLVDTSLAGGQSSVTISTTWIIIGLLVLILIIVAV